MYLKPIPPSEIREVLSDAKKVLRNEEQILSIEGEEVFFVGDIHGDLVSATKIFKLIQRTKAKFVFLGDYVDRGRYGVEVAVGLLRLKIKEPERITLLRGNHETTLANEAYGFLSELYNKYHAHAQILYKEFNETFAQMPIVAIVNSEIICMHGGIPKDATLKEIGEIPKNDLEGTHPILLQVLWNDPEETIEYYAPSYRGPGIYLFGEKAFEEFMNREDLHRMIRAHTYLPQGAKWFFKNRLLSLFSPTEYVGNILQPKIAKLIRDKLVIIDLQKL